MNRFLRSLVLLLTLIPTMTSASTTGDVTMFVGAVGGLVGIGALAGTGFTPRSLPGWNQNGIDSATLLKRQCGANVEARLLSNNAYTWIWMALKETSGHDRLIDAGQTRLRFGTGIERAPVRFDPAPSRKILGGVTTPLLILIPTKGDFEKAETLAVNLPIKDSTTGETCSIDFTFVRGPASNADVESSSNSYASAEMQFGYGPTLAQTGNLNDTAKKTGQMDLLLRGWPNAHHGGYLAMSLLTFSDASRTKLATNSAIEPRLAFIGFSLGYSYRHQLSNRFQLTLEGGPVIGGFTYNQTESKTVFALQPRGNLDYEFAMVPNGVWQGRYAFGISLSDTWFPFSTVVDKGSTHSIGSVLYLKCGF